MEEEKELSGEKYWIGHTREYVKAAVKAQYGQILSNQIVHGKITGVLQEDIMLLSIQ
jgi:threonylcarbamoyladenosine tRNA methylthiotransferase MtaB